MITVKSTPEHDRSLTSPVPPPPFRRLRGFSFDPSLATQLDTAVFAEVTFKVPWEKLEIGPVGEYVEVVDYDPATGCFYLPVDLNDGNVLAQDGLAPDEGNPQFHQQMVYVVAMTTVSNFERALGRKALWAPYMKRDENGELVKVNGKADIRLVDKLRIYPHALREANAYYSPDKKALLFGYFPTVLANPGENLPGGMVFTCLSHDVVAHETTHALLDGLHRYFAEPSNGDVLAFHEAFADIVALFQHFTQPEALRHQIARTRGNLATQNLLGELAHQFGQAIGNHGALRDAIGKPDPETGKWIPAVPDPEDYQKTTEPHSRGAILVAAMFDSFLAIYQARIADLLRIATGGPGVLPDGNIHPDLVNRLADEATKTADHVLLMAIRALDYCPPVDITFGEYLRAVVTADVDLMPAEESSYRIAVIEAFRRRGIYSRGVRTLAEDALRWQSPDLWLPDFDKRLNFADLIAKLKTGWKPETWKSFESEPLPAMEWQASGPRSKIAERSDRFQQIAHYWINETLLDSRGEPKDPELVKALGLELSKTTKIGSLFRKADGTPKLEIHSLRVSYRPTSDGKTITDLVIEMTQRRRGYLDDNVQKQAENLPANSKEWDQPPFKPHDFKLRGGCTLLVDGETGEVRYCIAKPITNKNESRLIRQRAFTMGVTEPSLRATYSVPARGARVSEPFAALHRGW
jgi:hypothetical protein